MNIIATFKNAKLPGNYEAARNSLAQCQTIDECKDWADKAAALASYGRQAEDVELEKMAMRIRARAMRRAGELAKQMMQPRGTNRFTNDRDQGSHISIPKDTVQEISGFSKHQLNSALSVANVPVKSFEDQLESSNPPTLTELARQGTQKRDTPIDPQTWLKGRDGETYNAILHMVADITEYADAAAHWNVEGLLPHFTDADRRKLRGAIAKIDAIHDKIITRI